MSGEGRVGPSAGDAQGAVEFIRDRLAAPDPYGAALLPPLLISPCGTGVIVAANGGLRQARVLLTQCQRSEAATLLRPRPQFLLRGLGTHGRRPFACLSDFQIQGSISSLPTVVARAGYHEMATSRQGLEKVVVER